MTLEKKISVYVRSEISPAGYYRVLQYTNRLKETEVKERILVPERVYTKYHGLERNSLYFKVYQLFVFILICVRALYYLCSDLFFKPNYIVISRTLVPKHLPSILLYLLKINLRNTKLIWDFDDDIVEGKEICQRSFDFFSRMSEHIIVTHDFLKTLILPTHRKKVTLLPTTDGDFYGCCENNKLSVIRKKLYEKEIHLVWVGTGGNLVNFEGILSTLEKLAVSLESLNKQLVLNIVCNKPLIVSSSKLIIHNIPWSKEKTGEILQKSHIGIMPLKNVPYSKGKGGFKLVQCMSVGLPVIGSAVGFNNEIIEKDFGCLVDDSTEVNLWSEYLFSLSTSWESYQQKSIHSYTAWTKKFSFDENLKVWKNKILCK